MSLWPGGDRRQSEVLDEATVASIGRWRAPVLFVLFIGLTLGIMTLRSVDISWGWRFDSEEFGAIGQWVGGIASAFAVYIALSSLVDERRRGDATARLSDARRVHYAFDGDPDPTWVIRNNSTRRVIVITAGGKAVDPLAIDPGGAVKVDDASALSGVGWHGDPPDYPLVFWDGEYEWEVTEDQQVTGTRRSLRRERPTPGEAQ